MTPAYQLILAPLRGVTIRTFRAVFAPLIRGAGFTEAVTPFITAAPGYDPLKDRETAGGPGEGGILVTPQFIGKDPKALRHCLERVKAAGFSTADLNCGCPFPMVRNKGRGSGLLRTPDVLVRMVETGCEVMGDGNFSVKARLGIDSPGELLSLMPILNGYPLRFLAVHARTARQMYEGECDRGAFDEVLAVARMKVVFNGDARTGERIAGVAGVMVGRSFIRALGERVDIEEWLGKYAEASARELCGERPVLGRLKELLSYWKDLPAWRRRWQVAKLARNLRELQIA
ncbi:MAG: tRNA-dihydrouridine synthase family protein [Kiritimatiellae bacterium]|nr:tRNA-dihydrouridine synthase family protein [Kiritimatiellia bacterium]